MFLPCLLISFFFFGAKAGELIIVQSPPSLKFQEGAPIDQHLVPEIFSLAMGFTTQQESDWSGMIIKNPFALAKTAVVLYVDGISTLGTNKNMLKYAVNNNEDEYLTWKTIKNRINDRYPIENNTLMRVDLAGEDIPQINAKTFQTNSAEESDFLNEITHLEEYMKNIKISNGIPDLYWFSLKSLHQLSDLKGSHHASTIKAKEMVYDSLLKLSSVYNSAYSGQALVVVLVSDASHTRRTRSTADKETPNENPNTEELKDNIYDPDFPVIFNIILWFTVTLFLSLLAVSVFIASMDPGRDSIIYRMTSNRMKKDS